MASLDLPELKKHTEMTSKLTDQLTDRQARILEYIRYQNKVRNYPPSVREIGEAVGLSSSSTVHNHLNQLERRGLIKRDPSKSRTVQVVQDAELDQKRRSAVSIPIVGNVAAGGMSWRPTPRPGATLDVLGALHAADLAQLGQHALAPIWDQDLELDRVVAAGPIDRLQELGHAQALSGGDRDGCGISLCKRADRAPAAGRSEQIDLVHRHHARLIRGVQVGEDALHRLGLLVDGGRASIQDLDDQVGLGHLFQSGPERRDQVGGQLLDETNRVGQKQLAPRRQLELSRRRVQRREQLLLRPNPRAGEHVEQGRLPRIRVSDNGRRLQLGSTATGPLLMALVPHLFDLPVEVAHPPANPASLDLDLLLAKTAAGPHSPPPPAHLAVVGVRADQPWQEVVESGCLHLQAPLMGAGMLGEYLEDDLGAIEHPGLDLELEVALLAGTQVLIADHEVERALELHVPQRLDLAHPDEMRGVDVGSPLHVGSDNFGTRGPGEVGELAHLLAHRLGSCAGEKDPDEIRSLARAPGRDHLTGDFRG